jgi:poly-gamma-glutamate synthesis protein (capsule biosynthesis protein)
VAWTFSLSNKTMPPGQEYLVNVLRLNLRDVDLSPLRLEVEALRTAGADIVVALPHWGLEYEAYPNRALMDNAHRIIELGVDLIIGNHPHHAQPWERYQDRLIVYAQGDFCSYQRGLPTSTYLSSIARVELAKGIDAQGRKRAWIHDVQLKPVYPFAIYQKGRCADFRMLDLTRLAQENFSCALPGFTARHRRKARRLWTLAQTLRIID